MKCRLKWLESSFSGTPLVSSAGGGPQERRGKCIALHVQSYYDDTIDESMTELMSDYVNSGSLYNVMDMAIAYGINPYIYTSAHEGEEGYVSGSDVP